MITQTGSIHSTVSTSSNASTTSALQAGKDFEAMAIGEFLQPMFQSEQAANNMFGGGSAEATLKPMLVSEYAKLIEARGGLGLAAPIAEKLAQAAGATRR